MLYDITYIGLRLLGFAKMQRFLFCAKPVALTVFAVTVALAGGIAVGVPISIISFHKNYLVLATALNKSNITGCMADQLESIRVRGRAHFFFYTFIVLNCDEGSARPRDHFYIY